MGSAPCNQAKSDADGTLPISLLFAGPWVSIPGCFAHASAKEGAQNAAQKAAMQCRAKGREEQKDSAGGILWCSIHLSRGSAPADHERSARMEKACHEKSILCMVRMHGRSR